VGTAASCKPQAASCKLQMQECALRLRCAREGADGRTTQEDDQGTRRHLRFYKSAGTPQKSVMHCCFRTS